MLQRVKQCVNDEYRVLINLTSGRTVTHTVGFTKGQACTAFSILTQEESKLNDSIRKLANILLDLQQTGKLRHNTTIKVALKAGASGIYVNQEVDLYWRQVDMMCFVVLLQQPAKLEAFRNCLSRVIKGTAEDNKPLFPFLPLDGIFEKSS